MTDRQQKGVLTPEAIERLREVAKVVDTWPAWMKGSPRNERTTPQPQTSRSASETASSSSANTKA